MDEGERAGLIERYEQGPAELEAAIEEVGDAGLDVRPSDGGWTPREIVHHCADSEMTSAIRLRRLIAEDGPEIVGYDPDEFATRLFYSERPIASSIEAVRASRKTSAEILSRITGEQWSRTGTHSEGGDYGVELWLEIYSAHCHDHADQIRRAISG